MSVRPEVHAGVADADLTGSTALVTGSSDGIGREAALALGRLGAHVLIHGRSREKADRVVTAIESEGGTADGYVADFADLAAVRDLAAAVRADQDRIDVLANNAGAYFPEGRLTDAGVEATMAVNHLAPFLLTHRLLPAMPADGRVVTTASGVHGRATLRVDALEDVEEYDGLAAYARSKLANVLFTRELSRRIEDPTATCFHPGLVPGSALWRSSPVYVRAAMSVLAALPDPVTRLVGDTPATGGATLTYLTVAPAAGDWSGEYVSGFEPVDPAPSARDDDLARRLWTWSEEAVGLDAELRL